MERTGKKSGRKSGDTEDRARGAYKYREGRRGPVGEDVRRVVHEAGSTAARCIRLAERPSESQRDRARMAVPSPASRRRLPGRYAPIWAAVCPRRAHRDRRAELHAEQSVHVVAQTAIALFGLSVRVGSGLGGARHCLCALFTSAPPIVRLRPKHRVRAPPWNAIIKTVSVLDSLARLMWLNTGPTRGRGRLGLGGFEQY